MHFIFSGNIGHRKLRYELFLYMAVCGLGLGCMGHMRAERDSDSAAAYMVPEDMPSSLLHGMSFVCGGGGMYHKRVFGQRDGGFGLHYCAGGTDEGSWPKPGAADAAG